MKKIVLIIWLVLPLSIFSQTKLSKVQVNENISLKIPTDFVTMSQGDRISKFVSSKVPLAMFTSMDREADLGVNTNIMQWIEGDEEKLRLFYKGTFNTLFDKVEYMQDEIREINGRTFIVFEFISTLTEENAFSGTTSERNYTYIQYTTYNGQVLLFNFGCKARLANEYREVAKAIMESVKVKK